MQLPTSGPVGPCPTPRAPAHVPSGAFSLAPSFGSITLLPPSCPGSLRVPVPPVLISHLCTDRLGQEPRCRPPESLGERSGPRPGKVVVDSPEVLRAQTFGLLCVCPSPPMPGWFGAASLSLRVCLKELNLNFSQVSPDQVNTCSPFPQGHPFPTNTPEDNGRSHPSAPRGAPICSWSVLGGAVSLQS